MPQDPPGAELRLRTIRVSTNAAIASTHDAADIAAAKVRSLELLDELERLLRADGADADLLESLETDRRALVR